LTRRGVLKALSLAAGATLLCGHTPYGQWTVYRKKHLLIGCHKTDPRTYDLAKQVVAVLGEHLPAAKSRVARAPTPGRLASLLGTGQMDICVLGWRDAQAMIAGQGQFKPYGALPLKLITPLGDRALIAHEKFRKRHAWLLAAALADSALPTGMIASELPAPPWHPGAKAFREGAPEPQA